jgi:hypothetical protein
MYAVIKLNGKDLVKIIEGFRCVIININFLSHPLLHLFINIYYDKSKQTLQLLQLFIMTNLDYAIYNSIDAVILITATA